MLELCKIMLNIRMIKAMLEHEGSSRDQLSGLVVDCPPWDWEVSVKHPSSRVRLDHQMVPECGTVTAYRSLGRWVKCGEHMSGALVCDS